MSNEYNQYKRLQQAIRSLRRRRRALRKTGMNTGRRLSAFASLTLGTPFRWIWCWMCSRSPAELVRALPAIIVGSAVVVLLIVARRTDASRLSTQYRVAALEAINHDDLDAAGLWLEQSVQLQPKEPDMVFALAQHRLKTNDYARGRALMERLAPDDGPGYPQAHLWMAVQLFANPQMRSADGFECIEHHLTQAALDPQLAAMATSSLGDLAVARQDFVTAIRHYRSVAESLPLANLSLAVALRNQGQKQASISAAKNAIRYLLALARSIPDDWECQRQLAEARVLANEFQAAEIGLLTYSQSHPADTRTAPVLADVYVGWLTGSPTKLNLAQQLSLLDEGMSVAPGDTRILSFLAKMSAGTWRGSTPAQQQMLAATLKQALTNGIAPAAVHLILAGQQLAAGNNDGAMLHLKIARQHNERVPMILNNLAREMLHFDQPDLERAMQYVDLALAMEVQPEYHATRGLLFERLNEKRDAIASYEQALIGYPDNGPLIERLISLYESFEDVESVERLRERQQSE